MLPGRRYRILGKLGKGGFGTVYRADLLGESGFTRRVALKVLNADMEKVSNVASRLRDEARLLGLLRHRAIVDVDGLVRLDGRWTVVMEYIEGADLGKILAHGPVPQGPALEILGEVAGALHVAYNQPGPSGRPLRLLHRDLKPPNVFLTPNGEVKVLDFGVARAEFAGREAQTRMMLLGSLGYMAPERFEHEESHAGDVFALGILLYEMLAGSRFGRPSANPEVFEERRREVTSALRGSGRALDPVVDFVEEMIAYAAADRPTAREVERRCRDLRLEVRGPWLREWAEDVVPSLVPRAEDLEEHDFTSDVVTESTFTGAEESLDGGWPEEPPPARPAPKTMHVELGGPTSEAAPRRRSAPTIAPFDEDDDEPPAPPSRRSLPTFDPIDPPQAALPARPSRTLARVGAIVSVPLVLGLMGLAFVFTFLCCGVLLEV